MNRTHILLFISVLVMGSILTSEIILREKYGFANAPLYRSSDKYEYMAQPNQHGLRFGCEYYYNAFSQRSAEIDRNRRKVLGLGDSVIFGGMQTEQDSIATSIISNETAFQMLNISAGSWGPDNCAAYLNEEGTFDAEAMILVVSSHDAHDNMDFTTVVGVHKSYPDKQYKLAWLEVIDRYVIPRLFKSNKSKVDPDQAVLSGIQKNGKGFNVGFEQLREIAADNNMPLFIYLHAEQGELINGDYNAQGYEIINWSDKNDIKLIKSLDYDFSQTDYRDGIHLNKHGQRKLAEIIKKDVLSNMKN